MDKPSYISVEYEFLATGDIQIVNINMSFDNGPAFRNSLPRLFERPAGFRRLSKLMRKAFNTHLQYYYLDEFQIIYGKSYQAKYVRKDVYESRAKHAAGQTPSGTHWS